MVRVPPSTVVVYRGEALPPLWTSTGDKRMGLASRLAAQPHREVFEVRA
jgi:hypothetical protein